MKLYSSDEHYNVVPRISVYLVLLIENNFNKNNFEQKTKKQLTEPPLRSKQPAMFTGHKSCDSGNNNFSICHVTSRWSLDKIVM